MLGHFFLRITWNVCTKNIPNKNWSKKSSVLFFSEPLVHGGFGPQTPQWGFCLQALDTFGLNHHSQLVLGYHWLELLNQVQLNIFWNDKKFSFFLVHWYDLNSTISQKLKIAKIGKLIFIRFSSFCIFPATVATSEGARSKLLELP